MLARGLDLRRPAGVLFALGDDVVDILLVGGHVLDVVLEEDALARLRPGGRILDKLLHAVGVLPVHVHRLLQNGPERRGERVVFGGILLHFLQDGKDLRRDRRLDLADDRVVLQHLARHVERQIRRIHHAFHEPQPARQQKVDVVADEDVAHVKRKSALLLRHEEVHRRLLRDEQERLELDRALAGERNRLERILEIVRQVLVEFGVLLRLHILLGALPQRHARVEGLGLVLFAALLVLGLLVLRRVRLLEVDRVGDEVRIFLHQVGDAPAVEILLLVRAQVQRDRRAEARPFRVRNRVAPAHIGLPAERRVRAALFRDDRHLVRHHERRVEPDAELSDQLRQRLAALLLQRLAESFRAARGDRAEVLLQIRRVHPQSVVRDGQRLRGTVRGNVYAPVGIVRQKLLLGQSQILRAVYRVGRVGNELAQEDLLLGIERIDDEIEHLGNLGLE